MARNKVARMFAAVSTVVLVSGLAGCANYPTLDNMTVTSMPNLRHHQKSVAVTTRYDKDMRGLKLFKIPPEQVTKSIQDSITANAAFKQIFYGPGADYVIDVTITDLKEPSDGFDMKTDVEALWILYDAKSGKVVMKETIRSNYTATLSQNFDGSGRFMLSILGAIRENTRQGLAAISRLKLD